MENAKRKKGKMETLENVKHTAWKMLNTRHGK